MLESRNLLLFSKITLVPQRFVGYGCKVSHKIVIINVARDLLVIDVKLHLK